MASSLLCPNHLKILETETRWSQLPDDLLDLIFTRLTFLDCFRFGSVCSPWRSVMLARRCVSRPPPLLLMHRLPCVCSPIADSGLFCLCQGKFQKLSIKLQIHDFGHLIRCYGSTMGWLAIDDLYLNYFLLNPISRERIDLPSMDPPWRIWTVVLSSAPTAGDCIVIAQGSSYRNDARVKMLASCRPGDKEWTAIDNGLLFILSMTFHKGELYILSCDGNTRVYAFDPHPRLIGSIARITGCGHHKQLVESGGELLLVVKIRRGRRRNGRIVGFEVFKLEAGRWEMITSLGDRMLFLSDLRSESVSTKELMGSDFRGNSIYYHQMWPDDHNVSVYSMEDGSFQRLPLPDEGMGSVGWIMPSSWSS